MHYICRHKIETSIADKFQPGDTAIATQDIEFCDYTKHEKGQKIEVTAENVDYFNVKHSLYTRLLNSHKRWAEQILIEALAWIKKLGYHVRFQPSDPEAMSDWADKHNLEIHEGSDD